MGAGMRLLSEADIARLVEPETAIALAERAYIEHATGALPDPARLDLRRNEPKAGMLVLAGFSAGRIGIVKSNMHAYGGAPPARRTASLLAVWDMAACVPLALISSAGFNGHRTASGFAAAARALAPRDARTLTVFGAGHLAAWTVRYLALARPIERVVVVGRRREQAQLMAARLGAEPLFAHIRMEVGTDPARAAADADIIAAVTSSDTPVFPGEAVRRGTLVVLGGANRSAAREVDDTLARRATIYVDHLAGCMEKAGDIRIPLASGVMKAGQIAGEIGALLAAGSPTPAHDVVAFKSIGIAPQDLILAQHILDRADALQLGTLWDPLDGAGDR